MGLGIAIAVEKSRCRDGQSRDGIPRFRQVFTREKPREEEEQEEETRESCAGDSRNVSVPVNQWRVAVCGGILSDLRIDRTSYVRGDLKRKRRFIAPHDR